MRFYEYFPLILINLLIYFPFVYKNRRRQHRLEQEQADIEYEIRVLMAQPECNKTDSDKAREEALISRLVEVIHCYCCCYCCLAQTINSE